MKALAIRERILGAEHPDTAQTYNNIAAVYVDQGEYAVALKWFKKAYHAVKKILGDNHPDTIIFYQNIKYTYNKAGYAGDLNTWLLE